MEKEASCINSRAILDYLRAHDIDYSGMMKDLDPEIDGLEDPESFLRDPINWISSGVVTKLFERSTRLLDDEQAAYKVGQYVTENLDLGFVQRIMVKAFWSSERAIKHSQKINDQLNRSKKVKAPARYPRIASQDTFFIYQIKSIFSIPIAATPAADPIISILPPVPAA